MLKTTLWHAPEGFHFWLRTGELFPVIGESKFQDFRMHRFVDFGDAVAIYVVSEFSEIPITVEYDSAGADPIDIELWDRVIECPIEVRSDGIVFESSVAEEFGRLAVPSGRYRLRVYYGGQETRRRSGESADYYSIQIWPSSDSTSVVLKPER